MSNNYHKACLMCKIIIIECNLKEGKIPPKIVNDNIETAEDLIYRLSKELGCNLDRVFLHIYKIKNEVDEIIYEDLEKELLRKEGETIKNLRKLKQLGNLQIEYNCTYIDYLLRP